MAGIHVNYFYIGIGRWAGNFMFRVTDWSRLRRASIGVTNLFLVVGMHTIVRVFGRARTNIDGHKPTPTRPGRGREQRGEDHQARDPSVSAPRAL
jgi:hypothetical protein